MKLMNFASLFAATVTAAALFSPASGYRVEPMRYSLSPSGQGASIRVLVTNTETQPLNLDVSAKRASIDGTGKRTLTPADDDFMVFPAQATIQPGKSQSFMVRYVGQTKFDAGRIYVVRFTQLTPIAVANSDEAVDKKMTGMVGMLLNFNTTAVVQPASFKPQVQITHNLSTGPDGTTTAQVSNTGTGVADLADYSWSVERKDGTTEKIRSGIDLLFGDSPVLAPGGVRTIRMSKDFKGPGTLIALPPH